MMRLTGLILGLCACLGAEAALVRERLAAARHRIPVSCHALDYPLFLTDLSVLEDH